MQTTEMWDAWNLAHEMHKATFDHPEIYSFVDISQNNHPKGQARGKDERENKTGYQKSFVDLLFTNHCKSQLNHRSCAVGDENHDNDPPTKKIEGC